MKTDKISQKFKNLTVWKRGGERAPHKPLLVLYALSTLLNNNKRLIPYKKIDSELGRLLKDFGPLRTNYHPEYPFWRLQKDNIWEITNADKIRLSTSGDPSKNDLLNYNVAGGFTETIADYLKNDLKLVNSIVLELLEDNFPSSVHDDILQAVGLDLNDTVIVKKSRDIEFRAKVLRAYEYKCAICGFDVKLGHYPVALEAAHIKWHQAGGPDNEINGMALCALHHKLFDRGAITLSKNHLIHISDRAHGSYGFQEWLMNYQGKKINLPFKASFYPDIQFINWHVKEVFKGESRGDI